MWVIDVLALLELVELGAEAVAAFNELRSIIVGEPEEDYSDLSYEERKTALREMTRMIVRLDLDVNCYPLGYETTLLFDLEGNPLP